MPALISELIVSLDMCARGTKSPGYFGYSGPQFDAWIAANNAKPHRKLMGRKTYELLNSLSPEARDEGWHQTSRQPGYLFSRTLETCDWPGLQIVRDDMVGFVRKLKQDDGSELRVLGSLSIMRQLIEAGLLDELRLMVCPLVLPKTGVEHFFEGLVDIAFTLSSQQLLDDRVLLLAYAPSGSPPGSTPEQDSADSPVRELERAR
jgi:dihydrofolate reductase